MHPCLGPVCVWHRGLKTVQKKRKGWVTTSIRCKRGVNWHRLLARPQCMVGRQHPGASRHREKMLGAKPASQWGLWGWWKGDQIRRRGENWDRFSCRCWDNRRTNDLIERLGENRVWEGLQWVGMEVDHKRGGFELKSQTNANLNKMIDTEVVHFCNSYVKDTIIQEYTHVTYVMQFLI